MLKVLSLTLGAGAAGSVGGPLIGALVGPARIRTVFGADGFVRVGPLESLPEDGVAVALEVVVEHPKDAWSALPSTVVGAVYVAKRGDGVAAYSTVCPHLGCRVEVGDGGSAFVCPCHDSAFGPDGAVLSGPSPRGLDPLEARVVDGFVEVRFVRFKSGTPDRVVV